MVLLLYEYFYVYIKQVFFLFFIYLFFFYFFIFLLLHVRISAWHSTCECIDFQSGLVRDAAWKSDWPGSPVSHQRSVNILMTVSVDFTLTAGKIIPVSRRTMLRVRNGNAETERH
jgi:hypothetical protein